MLKPRTGLRQIQGLDGLQKEAIKIFMKGAVYCWVKNRPDEAFAAHDLMGGENAFWERTPLYALFQKHRTAGKKHAAANEAAGQDLGWLLKEVLSDDKSRVFKTVGDGWVKRYVWVRK